MKQYIFTKGINLFVMFVFSFGVFCLPSMALSIKSYDFADFTEEDSMNFVEQCDIDIPEEFLQLEDFPSFTQEIILQSYYNPNTAFCFNYSVTQRYAEDIRTAVRSHLNLSDIPAIASTIGYNLQHSTVMDENGNWVTIGGYYDPNWNNYNCYAYSIKRAEQPQFYSSDCYIQYQPGDICGNISIRDTTTIYELASIVENDLIAMGYSNVSLSSTIPTIDSSQELICVRRRSSYDYHFMRYDLETDAWYHKPGRTSILKYNYVPSNDVLWYGEYSDDSGEHSSFIKYDSDIVFISYCKNQISDSSNETTRKFIQPNKDVFCELIFENSGNNKIELISDYSIEYEIYDEKFDVISSGSGTSNVLSLSLASGKYFLRINFESYTDLHYVDISVHSHSYTNHYSQGSEDHAAYCICGEYLLQNHNFIIQSSNSSSGHQLVCVCGETKTEAHYDKTYEKCDNSLHAVYCECGYLTGYDFHSYVTVQLQFRMCSCCGYVMPANPGPGQVIMGEEDEEPTTE